jgi:hypothetical protein
MRASHLRSPITISKRLLTHYTVSQDITSHAKPYYKRPAVCCSGRWSKRDQQGSIASARYSKRQEQLLHDLKAAKHQLAHVLDIDDLFLQGGDMDGLLVR